MSRDAPFIWKSARLLHMIRILLADDHALFRQGLKSLLETEPDFKVMGEAKDGRDALRHHHDACQCKQFCTYQAQSIKS